jgi:hypothetical protein
VSDIVEHLREELLSRHNELRAKAEEIEWLRGLLREALESHDPPVEWYWRVREALGYVPLG